VSEQCLEVLRTAALTGLLYHTGAPDIVRLPVKEAPRTLNEILEIAALGDFPYDMCEDDDTKHLAQKKREGFAEELSRRLTHTIACKPRPLLPMWENGRSRDSEGSGSDTYGFTVVHRPKRDSASLERFQDEPNKRGRLSVSSSNAPGEAVSEIQRLVWEEEPSEWRSEGKRVHSSMAHFDNRRHAPSSEPPQPLEQRQYENNPAVGNITHQGGAGNGMLDQAVEETTLASDVDDSVDAVTPGTESDDFEHIFAVGELELQENSDSEWSVV